MVICFAIIAIEIKVIDNTDLAILFPGVKRYNIALIIIPPIVWNPFRVAARGIFYTDLQGAVIVFNFQKFNKGSIAFYLKIRFFIFFFDNSNITFITYKKLNTRKRLQNKFLFIVVIRILILLFALSEKNTNVNTEKLCNQRK